MGLSHKFISLHIGRQAFTRASIHSACPLTKWALLVFFCSLRMLIRHLQPTSLRFYLYSWVSLCNFWAGYICMVLRFGNVYPVTGGSWRAWNWKRANFPSKILFGEGHKGGLGTSAGQKRAPDPLDCSYRHQADVGAVNQTQVFCRRKTLGYLLPLNTFCF